MSEDIDAYPGTPRWVKVLGLVVIALIVVAFALGLLLGGEHGPARHVP